MQKKIVAEIENANFFTVMADLTPDLSNKEMLSLVIRSVDKTGTPKGRLLSVIEVDNKTGI